MPRLELRVLCLSDTKTVTRNASCPDRKSASRFPNVRNMSDIAPHTPRRRGARKVAVQTRSPHVQSVTHLKILMLNLPGKPCPASSPAASTTTYPTPKPPKTTRHGSPPNAKSTPPVSRTLSSQAPVNKTAANPSMKPSKPTKVPLPLPAPCPAPPPFLPHALPTL